MNRKRKSKLNKEVSFLNPYNDPVQWVGSDFSTPPLDAQWQSDFQRKIDSAFGAENALILAWSGQREYWDEFYTDWFGNGAPKEESLEKKPIILFGKYDVNDTDYLYIYPPRWLILERHHPVQYEASWESDAWASDERMTGGKKRIRNLKVPNAFYVHLKTIAEHDEVTTRGERPRCCRYAMENAKRICYGRYRPPSDEDLEYVRNIRINMDAAGVSQRNDEKTGEKLLKQAAASTSFYIRQAEQQKSKAIKEYIMSHPRAFLGTMPQDRGITLSAREIEEAVLEGLEQSEQERFGSAKQTI
jgi:hypothetical protein